MDQKLPAPGTKVIALKVLNHPDGNVEIGAEAHVIENTDLVLDLIEYDDEFAVKHDDGIIRTDPWDGSEEWCYYRLSDEGITWKYA